ELTAVPRAQAARAWPIVEKASPEAASLLREAVFVLFFDPRSPTSADEAGRFAQGGPGHNRSFWHAMQLVVFENGSAAIMGSFVAGVEGEGAMGIAPRLGAARPTTRRGGDALKHPDRVPPVLAFRLDARPPAEAPEPPDAGGILSLEGFGTR